VTTIWFDCPETPEPIGGIKQIYRHVDALNRIGIPASVVHATTGFRCRWFANDTPVTYAADLAPADDDILVVPECRPAEEKPLSDQFPGLRRVVFNQNCYLTFKDADLRDGVDGGYRSVYEDPATVAVITVSRDSADVLRYIFPRLPVHAIRYAIDPAVFRFGERKERTVACIARKNKVLREVLHSLRVRGSLDGYEVVVLDNVPEERVAEVMHRSLFFLTALNYEGFGLPPAEAMASGCVVVGFDGRGGREFLTPETGFPVPNGDLRGFVETVEAAMRTADEDPGRLDGLRRHASEFITTRYSAQREAESVAAAWAPVLAQG
jgi:hypothetical protein